MAFDLLAELGVAFEEGSGDVGAGGADGEALFGGVGECGAGEGAGEAFAAAFGGHLHADQVDEACCGQAVGELGVAVAETLVVGFVADVGHEGAGDGGGVVRRACAGGVVAGGSGPAC